MLHDAVVFLYYYTTGYGKLFKKKKKPWKILILETIKDITFKILVADKYKKACVPHVSEKQYLS